MNILLQILLPVLFLSYPFIAFHFYIKALEKKSLVIISLFTNESSESYKDLKVWFKNFDILKKKKKFEFNIFQTNYSYSDCDLILNNNVLVVIGKAKICGKTRYLTPTIFTHNDMNLNEKLRIVKYKAVRESGSELEIDFSDPNYTNLITLVLKRIDNELKNKIITRLK